MSDQPFSAGKFRRDPSQPCRAPLRHLNDRTAFLEIINTQRGGKACRAGRRQYMIGTGAVISYGLRAVSPEKQGACMANPTHAALWIPDREFQVLGCDAVRDFAGLIEAADLNQRPAPSQRCRNHVLPTAGTARFSSPLGVYDFQKRTSIIGVSREGAASLGRVASRLAMGEGLQAHARSAEYRFE